MRDFGLRRFWDRVSEGLTVRELWREFRREAGASYRLYAREADADLEHASRWRRWWTTARALVWAMFLRLSPARRAFLLLAVLLVLAPRGESGSSLPSRLGGLMLFGLLVLELADWVTMKRDLELAREIQHWLVPHQPPRIPGIECAFVTIPANTVAGDYYDVFQRPTHNGSTAPGAAEGPGDGAPVPVEGPGGGARAVPPAAAEPVVVVVADVAGKSMPAALLMATFQASLRTLMFEPLQLQRVVGRLNRYACEHSLEGRRFTTAFLAEIDPVAHRFSYVNAGHNAPILRRRSGEIVRLETGGLLLGVRAEAEYEAASFQMVPGDTLVIFTDGVADARSHGGERYGEQRLVELVRTLPEGDAALDAHGTLQRLLDSVQSHVGASPQEDDITCVVLRYRGDGTVVSGPR